MIYLASPYSHADPNVRQARFEQVSEVAAQLNRHGLWTFSPIMHGHLMVRIGMPGSWDYWEAFDREWIARCQALYVCCLDGWEGSKGVTAEIKIAHEMGKPVGYVDPKTCCLWYGCACERCLSACGLFQAYQGTVQ